MKSVRPLLLLAAGWLAAAPTTAADLRPSWECLPAQTAVMVRLPQPREFVETLKARTKFGGTLLGERRLERIGKLALDALRRDGGGEVLDGFDESLAKYGLEKSDLAAAFAGDMGFGVVVKRRDEGRPPLQMVLAWLEPGAGPAERLLAAGKRIPEERQAEGDAAPKRIDLEMAGHDVLWVKEPVMGLNVGDLAIEAGDDDDIEGQVEALQERIKAAVTEQTDLAHSFVTRIGGRLLVGQTIPGSAGVDFGDRDWDAESGADEAKETFLRFLVAHGAAGAAPLADILDMPGVRATLPEGLTFVDVVVDPRPLRAAFGDVETAEVAEFLGKIGLGTVGPFAWRQTLDGGLFHQGLFLSMPAPRRGLMQILDQPCDPSEPPPFVSNEAVSLTQVSLDLGKAYQTVREAVVAAGGEEAGNMFMTAEAQAQGWLGLDLPRFLSAFGSRHWIVDYPPRIAAAVAAGREAGAVAASLGDANRGAIVWQVTDEPPFRKVLQQMAPLAGGELKDEQGFGVIRIPGGAVAVGMNHLVVAIGDDSLERTLAGIRNPPAGEASLREGDAMRRAGKLLPLGPARMFAVGDATRTGGALGSLREMAANMEPDDVPDRYRELLSGLKDVLPTAAEMEGMFGVSVSTMRMTDDGLVLRSAWEMPPP
ncbi:MAG: hypothetical protein ACKOC4_09660 [Planctomycetia bacterium]